MGNARNKVNRNKAPNAHRELGQRDIWMIWWKCWLRKKSRSIAGWSRYNRNSGNKSRKKKRIIICVWIYNSRNYYSIMKKIRRSHRYQRVLARCSLGDPANRHEATCFIYHSASCLLSKNTCRHQPTALPSLLHRHRSFCRWKLGESNRDVRPMPDSNHRRTADR